MAFSATRYITLSLLVIPPIFLAAFFLAQFPSPPEAIPIYPSLASLPKDFRSWSVYPEDFYDGGAYASFPFGKVRYWMIGPPNGQKIVLIHGLSIPALVWKDIAPQLAKNGFRVLLYDLYGRGYSDAPQRPYDASLYTTQLALLMQHVKWENAHIAGLSMGGGIAAAFAASFPNLCTNKIALIASAGVMESNDFSRTSKVMSSPLVMSVVSSNLARMYMQRLGSNNPSTNPIQEIVQIQSAHLPGYNYALASSLRDGPIRGLASSFAASAHRDILLIWGTDDRTVPYYYAARLQALLPNAKLLTVDGAMHDVTLSHPEIVGEALVSFFKSGNVKGARSAQSS
ncbi:alpha/beta-hydrolase [Rickenella mellea]|uniref:Alpha/beta-hydrolase n=1 Tax=Rickenella mellea TaxID=50990 RepID=A0A4R5XG18_9AGAM|nr:alpha/beta-hydrolase [Rickenella mellea]